MNNSGNDLKSFTASEKSIYHNFFPDPKAMASELTREDLDIEFQKCAKALNCSVDKIRVCFV